jgi:hypothetical protein
VRRTVPFLLALACWPASARPQGGHAWQERRAGFEALDARTADEAELEAALAELAAAGPLPEASLCTWAGATAYTLFGRLRNQGQLARAAAALEHGLELCTEPGGLRPYLWIARSSLSSQLADYTGALEALDQAEAALDGAQRESALPASIWSLRAQTLIQRGVPDRAAPWVARALERAEALRGTPDFDAGVLIDALTKRANLRMATDSYELLRQEVEAVLADEELLGQSPTARARFLLRLGFAHLWFARGEDEHAARTREHLGAALAEPGIQAQDRLTAHLRLGQLELLTGNLDEARTALARAREVATTMERGGGSILVMDGALLSALEARVERRSPSTDPALGAAARERLRAAYDALLANWRARPASEGGVGFLRYPGHQDVVAEVLEGELAAAPGEGGRRAAFVQLARAHAVGDLPEALGAREPRWEEIAALAPAGGGLLVWLAAPGASHVLLADGAGTAHHRLADARDIEAPREALERLLAQSPAGLAPAALERRRSDLDGSAAHLGELLLPETVVARLAGWGALTLVADDLAGACALELVPVRGADGTVKPLFLSRPAAYLPGLAVGVALVARAPLAPAQREWPRDLCLVSDVRPASELVAREPQLAALPIDRELLDAWCEPFAPERVERLTGERATLAALAAASAARVQHFVTHGVCDPRRERSAGLLLTPGSGDEGMLFHEHTRALAAPALAVLSVCNAGAGPERVGDAGASDLSGSFLAAGADAVVLAPTPLPFEPVARAVPLLHAELARGATPAEALWRARVALVRDPTFADPYHALAALRVVGTGHLPIFPPDPAAPPAPRRYLFGTLIAAAFVLPAWLILHRRKR